MPNVFDFALAALLAVAWPLYTYFVQWPSHVRKVAAGEPDARVRMFGITLLEQWAMTGALAVLWFATSRPASALWLTIPTGWRLAVGAGVPILYVVLMTLQVPKIARSEAIRTRLRDRLESLRPLLPHRPVEWHWFVPLSITAGICEEVLFRGFLVWLLTPMLGLYGAALLSVVVFGLAHGYQGWKFGQRAFYAGIFMGLFALVTGSVIPGMILHALIDIGSGYVGYISVREPLMESARSA